MRQNNSEEYESIIQRIEQMEELFDFLLNITQNDSTKIYSDPTTVDCINKLTDYYENGQWMKDYIADEEGKLPRSLKRGVLSEDGVYNLLLDLEQIRKEMQLERIQSLRHQLHAHPELSGQEYKTKQALIDFLKSNTDLEIHPCGDGFYAAYRDSDPHKSSLALRADYDAVSMQDGTNAHLCGHDGHAAALCGAALLTVKQKKLGRNIFFLFQPAEETGEGAITCTELFKKEHVDTIYGIHNLPGFSFGEVITCPGTFACGSMGLTLHFHGKPTHAAYPENGISPAKAVGKLLCALTDLTEPSKYSGLTMATVIGTHMGHKAFGCAASDAEIWLTLRAEYNADIKKLYTNILNHAKELAEINNLLFESEMQDIFPATENNPACAQHVLNICKGTLLEAPMRWSEDFGHYLKLCPGSFIGIGAGIDHPPLHTDEYEYPDSLLWPTIEVFQKLMEQD